MSAHIIEHAEKSVVLNSIMIVGNLNHPSVLLGAFAGSIIFVVSSSDFALWVRFALFAASMLIGIMASEFTASLLSSLLGRIIHLSADMPVSVGATVASAAAVRILMFLSTRPLKMFSVFDRINKGGS